MDNEQTFTRQTVCQMARVSEEVFAFWVKRGLLSPVDGGAGKGSHRRFSHDHVRIACLLRAARDAGLNISALAFIAEQAAVAIAAYRMFDVPHRYFLDVVGAASEVRFFRRKGKDNPIKDFSYLRGFEALSAEEAGKLTSAATAMSSDDFDDRLLLVGHELVDATGYVTVSRNDDGSWHLQASPAEELGESTEASSDFYLVFSVGRIMAGLGSSDRSAEA